MNISTTYQVAGRFTLRRVKADTGEVVEALEFKNLITNLGLNQLGTATPASHAYVSTNSTAPTVLDSSLAGFLAATNSIQTTTTNSTSSSPYWYESTRTWRFAAGAAAGNLTKVGVGWNSTSASALWSSALIVDGLGNPTTLTVLSDEFLDVTYTLRYYPPLTDSVTNVVINGVTHTLTTRVANITGRTITLGASMVISGTVSAFGGAGAVLGPVTGSISGHAAVTSLGAPTPSAYVNNSLQVKSTLAVPLATGNVAGGITAITINSTTSSFMSCSTQMLISPAIPKDATKSMSLTFATEWARYP